MRKDKSSVHKSGIRFKITLIICIATLTILGSCMFAIYTFGIEETRKNIGEEYSQVADTLGIIITQEFNGEVEDIKTYASRPLWIDVVKEANETYRGMSIADVEQRISAIDKEWIEAAPAEPLISQYLKTRVSVSMQEIKQIRGNITEIFITDKFGGIVAASNKTSDFYQADELWWQKAYNEGQGGLFLGGIEFDDSSKSWIMPIAVPLKDDSGVVIGICKVGMSIERVLLSLSNFKIGSTGDAALVDNNGFLLFHQGIVPMRIKLSNFPAIQGLKDKKDKYALMSFPEIHKQEMFISIAQLRSALLSNAGFTWYVLVMQDAAETFLPIRGILFKISLLAALLVLIVLPLAFWLSGFISKPIIALHKATENVMAGNWDYKIDIEGTDEIGQFADTFREMIVKLNDRQKELLGAKEKLEDFSKTLEQKVQVRTKELAQAQEAALNILEDLQETKDAIAADKVKMESMVESMVEGVIMFDNQNRIIALNPQARRFLNYGVNEEITTAMLTEKLGSFNLCNTLEECQAAHNLVSKEIINPQGHVLRCEMTPVKGRVGNDEGVVIVLRDITKEKEIDQMKSEFISTVSHELRTPLSITKEGISLVLDNILGEVNEKQRKILVTSKDNIDRLSRIINDLLDISKIESGKVELKRELVDLTSLIKKTIAGFEPMATLKGLKLTSELTQNIVKIYADPDKLTQVFTNLIGNAIKFTQQGKVEVSCADKGDKVECSVSDTGDGIAKDNLPRVFDKFQQFGRVPGGGEKGTGLGLSIAKGIIAMHGGNIRVESQLGEGTRFTFNLPKHTSEEFFRESVKGGIKEALMHNSKMSVIWVAIEDFSRIKEEFSEERIFNIIKGMSTAMHNTLRREGDLIVRDTGELIIVLVDCDKENVLRIEGRLEQILEDYFIKENVAGRIKLKFGASTYPDDARGEDELIRKAKA